MNSTTMITGAGALTYTGIGLYDRKTKKINKDMVGYLVGTSIATGATAAIGASINGYTINQMHNKYASAYIESMSDEELEQALIEMDLLTERLTEKDVKTI